MMIEMKNEKNLFLYILDGSLLKKRFYDKILVNLKLAEVFVMYKIFIVEDDLSIQEKMAKKLKEWEFDLYTCEDFKKVEEEFIKVEPDLLLLDINLPYYDGFFWCKKIRKISKVPIIIISARESAMDQIMAMDIGADDYIVKPFYMEVFLAKIKAVLRRNYAYSDEALNVITYKDLKLNLNQNKLLVEEHEIELTKNEFIILQSLFSHSDKILTRNELMNALWNSDSFIDDNTLSVNVNRLRKKLSTYDIEELILTKKGIGYYLNENY